MDLAHFKGYIVKDQIQAMLSFRDRYSNGELDF